MLLSPNQCLREGSNALEVVLNHQQEYEEKVNVVYSAPIIDREEIAAPDYPYLRTDHRHPGPGDPRFPELPAIDPRRGEGYQRENSCERRRGGSGAVQPGWLQHHQPGFRHPGKSNLRGCDQGGPARDQPLLGGARQRLGRSHGAGVVARRRSVPVFGHEFSAFLRDFTMGSASATGTRAATVSGPIVKGRAWYFNAMSLQYDLNIVDELPSTANKNRNWFGSNLTRVQVNLSDSNLLSVGLLVNFQNSRHLGISATGPG